MSKFQYGKDIWVCEWVDSRNKWVAASRMCSSAYSKKNALELFKIYAKEYGPWATKPNGSLNMKLFRFRKYRRVEK